MHFESEFTEMMWEEENVHTSRAASEADRQAQNNDDDESWGKWGPAKEEYQQTHGQTPKSSSLDWGKAAAKANAMA